MLERLHALGFSTVVATPHMRPGMFDNQRDDLVAAFERMQPSCRARAGLPDVALSSEHYFDDVVYERLLAGEALPYPGGRAVLLEFWGTEFPAVRHAPAVRPAPARPPARDRASRALPLPLALAGASRAPGRFRRGGVARRGGARRQIRARAAALRRASCSSAGSITPPAATRIARRTSPRSRRACASSPNALRRGRDRLPVRGGARRPILAGERAGMSADGAGTSLGARARLLAEARAVAAHHGGLRVCCSNAARSQLKPSERGARPHRRLEHRRSTSCVFAVDAPDSLRALVPPARAGAAGARSGRSSGSRSSATCAIALLPFRMGEAVRPLLIRRDAKLTPGRPPARSAPSALIDGLSHQRAPARRAARRPPDGSAAGPHRRSPGPGEHRAERRVRHGVGRSRRAAS